MIRFSPVAAASLGLLLLATAGAAETVLKVETWVSPQHVQNSVVLPAWAETVAKATAGRVRA